PLIRDVIATGRDVNAAIDSGCAQLGIDREDAQFEIISLPKKGFLGLKTYPAKVKVFEEIPDPPKPAPKPAPQAAKPAAPCPEAPADGTSRSAKARPAGGKARR
ncbi:MAG: Jag N-terminal domain-containing protein, partial [Angelakisella sp.]